MTDACTRRCSSCSAAGDLADVRRDAVGDGRDVARVRLLAGERAQGRGDRAAARVPHHHYEAGAELRHGKLDGADLRRRDDVATDAHDEEIAEADIEDDLRECA